MFAPDWGTDPVGQNDAAAQRSALPTRQHYTDAEWADWFQKKANAAQHQSQSERVWQDMGSGNEQTVPISDQLRDDRALRGTQSAPDPPPDDGEDG